MKTLLERVREPYDFQQRKHGCFRNGVEHHLDSLQPYEMLEKISNELEEMFNELRVELKQEKGNAEERTKE